MRRNRQVSQIVCDRLIADGEWPHVDDVRRRVTGAALPAGAIDGLPSKLGREQSGKFTLTIRGLRKLPAAAEVLDDFLRAIRYAGSVYRNLEEDPMITIDGLVAELSISPGRARRAAALLESEGLVVPKAQCGEYAITPEIGRYGDVRSSRSYVRKRAGRQRRPRRHPSSAARRWLSERQPSTRDLLVVTFLPTLAVALLVVVMQGG